MNTDRIAEFMEYEDCVAFRRYCGPDYTVCGGINLPWAVRPLSSEEVYIMTRGVPIAIATDNAEPTDYKPSPMSYDDEPGDDA